MGKLQTTAARIEEVTEQQQQQGSKGEGSRHQAAGGERGKRYLWRSSGSQIGNKRRAPKPDTLVREVGRWMKKKKEKGAEEKKELERKREKES